MNEAFEFRFRGKEILPLGFKTAVQDTGGSVLAIHGHVYNFVKCSLLPAWLIQP